MCSRNCRASAVAGNKPFLVRDGAAFLRAITEREDTLRQEFAKIDVIGETLERLCMRPSGNVNEAKRLFLNASPYESASGTRLIQVRDGRVRSASVADQ